MDDQKWKDLSNKIGRVCALGIMICAMILILSITIKIAVWILML